MPAPQTTDLDNMNLIAYEVTIDDVSAGFTEMGTTSVVLQNVYGREENVSSLTGLVKAWKVGSKILVNTTIKDSSKSRIASLFLPESTVRTSGAATAYPLGNTVTALTSKKLLLHNAADDYSDRTFDWLFWKAIVVSDLTLNEAREKSQNVPIQFEVVPDFSKAQEEQMGIYGDWTIADAVPIGTFIQTGKLSVPAKQITAAALNNGQIINLFGYKFTGSATYTYTAAIDMVGDLAATESVVSVVFDTLNVASAIVAGKYIYIGTELMYVVSVTYTSTTAGTMVVVRNVCGTTLAAHLNNAVINVIDNPSIVDITNAGTWASSVVADATVGDTYTTSSQTKGKVTWVSSGATNITCTYNTTASPNLVLTVNA